MRWLTIGTLVFACTASACLDPDVGELQYPFCTDEDTDTDVPVSFSQDIVPLFERTIGGCWMCHTERSGSNETGITVGGLDLSTHEALMQGGTNSAGNIVVAGSPCASVLYLKLTPAPPSGARMPGNGPPYLTPEELRLVHDWIAEGGLDN